MAGLKALADAGAAPVARSRRRLGRGGGRRRCGRLAWPWSARRRGGGARLGRLQPLFECLDAGFVSFLHLPDLLANVGELGVGDGVCAGAASKSQRERAGHS